MAGGAVFFFFLGVSEAAVCEDGEGDCADGCWAAGEAPTVVPFGPGFIVPTASCAPSGSIAAFFFFFFTG